MADKDDAPPNLLSNSRINRSISAQAESLLSVSGAHEIRDSKRRDAVLAFSQYVIMMLSFLYALGAFAAHWHSCFVGYHWQITEWELAVIFTPLGGGTLWSWLAHKLKK